MENVPGVVEIMYYSNISEEMHHKSSHRTPAPVQQYAPTALEIRDAGTK